MRDCDAIVVGGGPAGSTFAWRMVRDGGRPLVIDRARFPRVKLCGGWITPPVIDALELDSDAYREQHTLQEFRGFNIWRLSGPEVRAEYDRTVSYGIVRSEFDHYLLRRSGAEVVEGTEVETIRREGTGMVVNERWRAPLLVGAGGHFCPVARFLGVNARREKCLVTLELERELDDREMAGFGVDATIPEVGYFDDFRGYGWCFRKGRFMNIGVGRTQAEGLKAYLAAFLDSLRRRGKVPGRASFQERDFGGTAYKLHLVTPRPYFADGVLLVGDAAGLTYNFSGEGIRPTVESANLAYRVVREAAGDYSGARLAAYRDLIHGAFGAPLTGWRFRTVEMLPAFWFRWIGKLLLSVPRLARGVAIDRLFLHHHELEPEDRPRPIAPHERRSG